MTATTPSALEELAARAAGRDGLADAFRATVELREELDRLEARHVDAALEEGWSWNAVGEALGVSKQAAHRRHARRRAREPRYRPATPARVLVTAEARRAVSLAGRAAAQLGHRCVRPDHLVLGLLDAGGPAGDALTAAGVTRERAREAAARVPATGDGPGVTPDTRALLKEALRQAVGRRDGWVGEEHLLLALLAGPQSGMVSAAGAEPATVREHLETAIASAIRLGAAVTGGTDGVCDED